MRTPVGFLSTIVQRSRELLHSEDISIRRAGIRARRPGVLRRRLIRIGPGLLFDSRTGSIQAL